jgi:hypothetical protein
MVEVAIVAFQHVLASEGLMQREELVIPSPRPDAVSPTLAGGQAKA